ncbi:hypothetical protein QBC36DRAFT_58849 [Triangularia setosa]|uniref:Uncharacterized protein n=1 Tax=Triangularia setosa TaxID=2587417 RepID=A0AAN6WD48_9PEZI|nr:hypothetical protein QBC36DRAFT_58849 [Podospora setosa]
MVRLGRIWLSKSCISSGMISLASCSSFSMWFLSLLAPLCRFLQIVKDSLPPTVREQTSPTYRGWPLFGQDRNNNRLIALGWRLSTCRAPVLLTLAGLPHNITST